MQIAKTYEPDQYEPTIYALWETANAFAPTGKGEPYTVIMPPPNANGNLHIGHALTYSLPDILIRYYRMKGRDAVYIPGADHAGFETWVVYEKELAKKGQSRFDFSREQLYSQVWSFVEANRGNVELQLRALGLSASWNDLVFTLDKKVIDTVYDTFKSLWNDGLVYRGERIVNYCTTHQTSFADIEVVHKTEKGKLWKIAYPTFDKIGEIVVATTRPETLLGDVAIAVHPSDERYKHLIGTRVILPLVDKEIPVIADEYVDKNFGTGAVKITPAHDPNDFEVGQRHDLAPRQVIDVDGRMINVPTQFAGITVEDARKRVLAALQAAELLRGEEVIEHAVGHCYKCDTIIQPLLKDQWFLNVRPLADRAKKALEEDTITFTPSTRKRALIQYLDNLKDWNLSRQIPWGIPIPAFRSETNPDDWIFDTRVEDTQIVVDGTTYIREEDTFDTWFSSGQWPFITTDALTDGKFASRYPIDTMVTAADILYQWVSRMIMLGLYRTNTVPFKEVYLNGLVLDEHSQKMSKSKGNVMNPMEMVAEYGSDALRLGIISNRSAGQNQAFSVAKIIAGRNFCNKLWNISRFIQDKLGDGYRASAPLPLTPADHWVARELTNASKQIEDQLAGYRFAEAAETIYHTVWDTVADWYIEASKKQDNPAMLAYVLETTLRLTHPFAPFVTETIWQSLPWQDSLLIGEEWPVPIEHDDIAAAEFERLQEIVSEVRYVTAELPGNRRYPVLYLDDTLLEENAELIRHLTRTEAIMQVTQPRGLPLALSTREIWLDVDTDTLYQHQSNLEQRLAEVRTYISTLEGRLGNENYVKKGPAELVEQSQKELTEKQALAARLFRELEVLSA